jgi:DNA-binding PadR family transcriptional regulator
MALPVLKIMLFKFIAENEKITGYDFLKFCKEKGISASAGSVYPHLKEFEERGLVKKKIDGRKKYYYLTEEGKKYYEKIDEYKNNAKNILSRMGIVFENTFSEMPKELSEKFRLLYYEVRGANWKNKKSMKKVLKTIEEIEKMLRRQIDGKSD